MMKIQIHDLIDTVMKMRPYYGCMLQCIQINVLPTIKRGTAGAQVSFDKQNGVFVLNLAEDKLGQEPIEKQAGAVIHELMHIQYGHLYWDFSSGSRGKWNVAMDLVINQQIQSLPDWCIDYRKIPDKYGNPLPPNLTEEEYFELLNDDFDNHSDDHDFEFDEDSLEHFESLIEKALKKSEGIPKNDPSFTKDKLHAERSISKARNKRKSKRYRSLLRSIVRTMLSNNVEKTWSKPSRRYGHLARGNKYEIKSKICFYIDTSGSISNNEIKKAIDIVMDSIKFMKTECYLAMFHAQLYVKPYKVDSKSINKLQQFQTGGTDLTQVLQSIASRNDDMSVIITDGEYDKCDVNVGKKRVLFIIIGSRNENHPLKHIGKTVVAYD